MNQENNLKLNQNKKRRQKIESFEGGSENGDQNDTKKKEDQDYPLSSHRQLLIKNNQSQLLQTHEQLADNQLLQKNLQIDRDKEEKSSSQINEAPNQLKREQFEEGLLEKLDQQANKRIEALQQKRAIFEGRCQAQQVLTEVISLQTFSSSFGSLAAAYIMCTQFIQKEQDNTTNLINQAIATIYFQLFFSFVIFMLSLIDLLELQKMRILLKEKQKSQKVFYYFILCTTIISLEFFRFNLIFRIKESQLGEDDNQMVINPLIWLFFASFLSVYSHIDFIRKKIKFSDWKEQLEQYKMLVWDIQPSKSEPYLLENAQVSDSDMNQELNNDFKEKDQFADNIDFDQTHQRLVRVFKFTAKVLSNTLVFCFLQSIILALFLTLNLCKRLLPYFCECFIKKCVSTCKRKRTESQTTSVFLLGQKDNKRSLGQKIFLDLCFFFRVQYKKQEKLNESTNEVKQMEVSFQEELSYRCNLALLESVEIVEDITDLFGSVKKLCKNLIQMKKIYQFLNLKVDPEINQEDFEKVVDSLLVSQISNNSGLINEHEFNNFWNVFLCILDQKCSDLEILNADNLDEQEREKFYFYLDEKQIKSAFKEICLQSQSSSDRQAITKESVQIWLRRNITQKMVNQRIRKQNQEYLVRQEKLEFQKWKISNQVEDALFEYSFQAEWYADFCYSGERLTEEKMIRKKKDTSYDSYKLGEQYIKQLSDENLPLLTDQINFRLQNDYNCLKIRKILQLIDKESNRLMALRFYSIKGQSIIRWMDDSVKDQQNFVRKEILIGEDEQVQGVRINPNSNILNHWQFIIKRKDPSNKIENWVQHKKQIKQFYLGYQMQMDGLADNYTYFDWVRCQQMVQFGVWLNESHNRTDDQFSQFYEYQQQRERSFEEWKSEQGTRKHFSLFQALSNKDLSNKIADWFDKDWQKELEQEELENLKKFRHYRCILDPLSMITKLNFQSAQQLCAWLEQGNQFVKKLKFLIAKCSELNDSEKIRFIEKIKDRDSKLEEDDLFKLHFQSLFQVIRSQCGSNLIVLQNFFEWYENNKSIFKELKKDFKLHKDINFLNFVLNEQQLKEFTFLILQGFDSNQRIYRLKNYRFKKYLEFTDWKEKQSDIKTIQFQDYLTHNQYELTKFLAWTQEFDKHTNANYISIRAYMNLANNENYSKRELKILEREIEIFQANLDRQSGQLKLQQQEIKQLNRINQRIKATTLRLDEEREQISKSLKQTQIQCLSQQESKVKLELMNRQNEEQIQLLQEEKVQSQEQFNNLLIKSEADHQSYTQKIELLQQEIKEKCSELSLISKELADQQSYQEKIKLLENEIVQLGTENHLLQLQAEVEQQQNKEKIDQLKQKQGFVYKEPEAKTGKENELEIKQDSLFMQEAETLQTKNSCQEPQSVHIPLLKNLFDSQLIQQSDHTNLNTVFYEKSQFLKQAFSASYIGNDQRAAEYASKSGPLINDSDPLLNEGKESYDGFMNKKQKFANDQEYPEKYTTLLHCAIQRKQPQLYEVLMNLNARVDQIDPHNRYPIDYAAQHGNLEMVQKIIEKHQTRTGKLLDNYSLNYAVLSNIESLEKVKFLLQKGADIDKVSDTGFSALHQAAGNGKKDIVKELIKNDADLNNTGLYNFTPLDYAIQQKRRKTAIYLKKKGAKSLKEVWPQDWV